MLKEAALIVISCVLSVQMGLVGAVEERLGFEFHILSCPKCSTWWISIAWHLLHRRALLDTVAVSFISSYIALWLALAYDVAAVFYNYAYERIKKEDEEVAELSADADELSEL